MPVLQATVPQRLLAACRSSNSNTLKFVDAVHSKLQQQGNRVTGLGADAAASHYCLSGSISRIQQQGCSCVSCRHSVGPCAPVHPHSLLCVICVVVVAVVAMGATQQRTVSPASTVYREIDIGLELTKF
jgi:hypothetical protein